jgi:hypothetical protein
LECRKGYDDSSPEWIQKSIATKAFCQGCIQHKETQYILIPVRIEMQERNATEMRKMFSLPGNDMQVAEIDEG